MTRTRQWAIFTALGCLAVMVVGWMLVVRPQHAHASSLRAQAASAQATNQQLQVQIGQLRQQEKGVPAQQAKLAKFKQMVPDNPALPALIRQLSGAADSAGVTLVSLAPGTPALVQTTSATAPAPAPGAASGATSTGTTAGAAPAAAASVPLASIPVQIQVQGSYYNLIQFFSAVENLSRALMVNGFNETPAAGSSGGSSAAAPTAGGAAGAGAASTLPPGTLSAQLNATVFMSPQVAPATTVK